MSQFCIINALVSCSCSCISVLQDVSEHIATWDIQDEALVLSGETLHILLLLAGGESPAVHQEEQGGGGLPRPKAPCSRSLGGESSSRA